MATLSPPVNTQVVQSLLTRALLDSHDEEEFLRKIDPVKPVLSDQELDILRLVVEEDTGTFEDIFTKYSDFSKEGELALAVMQDDIVRLGLSMSDRNEFSDNMDAWKTKYGFNFGDSMQKAFAEFTLRNKLGEPLLVLNNAGYDPLSWKWTFKQDILKHNDRDIMAKPVKIGEKEVTSYFADRLLTSMSTPLIEAGLTLGALSKAKEANTLFDVQTFAFDTQNDTLLDTILSNGGNPHETDKNHIDKDFILDIILRANPDDLPCLDVLSKHGANFNVCDEFGTTPFLLAVYNGNKEMAEWLSKQPGVDVHAYSSVFGDAETIALNGPARVQQKKEEMLAALNHSYGQQKKSKKNFGKMLPEVDIEDYPKDMLPFILQTKASIPPLAAHPLGAVEETALDLVDLNSPEMEEWTLWS